MLIYCSYPIMDQETMPAFATDLTTWAAKRESDFKVEVYQPRPLIQEQMSLHETLEKDLPAERKAIFDRVLNTTGTYEEFYSWIKHDKPEKDAPQVHRLPELAEILSLELGGPYSKTLVIKDLWVLSKCQLLVIDCNEPGHGGRGMELLWAKMLGIPIIGVSDRFLTGPWLQFHVEQLVRTPQVIQTVMMQAAHYSAWHQTQEKE